MHHYCTYFDHGFLARGLALTASLRQHDPDFRLWVLCFDDAAASALRQVGWPELRVVPLADLLAADPELAAVRPTRSLVEFYFTCTAAWLLHVWRQDPAIDLLTYVDADLYLFANPQPLFTALDGHSIGIIAHRFAPALAPMTRNGTYNVGWLSFRRDAAGQACLAWWRARCIEWCYDRHEDGKYADQKYLDDWPTRFPGVLVLPQPGANLAPWNLGTHRLSQAADGAVQVDGAPLYFYHFHGFKQLLPWLYDPHLRGYHAAVTPLLADAIYRPYIRCLQSFAALAPMRYRLRGNGWRLLLRRLLWYPRLALGLLRHQFIICHPQDP